MHLRFAHHGLQFFFLTFCVRGRRAVLSRLVEGEKRPVLSRAGECVKALWLAVHGFNPALTASDFVVMPDHVHLLLIVNYDKDPGFNPLVFSHWFMGESARMITTDVAVAPHPAADAEVLPLPVSLPRFYTGSAGAQSPSVDDFWKKGFWLDLSFSSRQLKAIRKYIRNNPARALWKRANPDMFVCRSRFRHPVLDPAVEDSRYLAAHRQLTLSALPVGAPFDWTTCHTMNDHAAAMCRRARGEE